MRACPCVRVFVCERAAAAAVTEDVCVCPCVTVSGDRVCVCVIGCACPYSGTSVLSEGSIGMMRCVMKKNEPVYT